MSDLESGSLLPFVHNRGGHVAVTWKDVTIIWGGMNNEGFYDPDTLYCHRDGKWFTKATGGDVPFASIGSCAAVIEDTVYVICGCGQSSWGSDGARPDIYALDFNSPQWSWTKLTQQALHPSNQPA